MLANVTSTQGSTIFRGWT